MVGQDREDEDAWEKKEVEYIYSLPDYRADLDERHGSTQKKIRMSTDIEQRVGNLLNNSQSVGEAFASFPSVSTDLGQKQSLTVTKSLSSQHSDSSKDKFNVALKERQEQHSLHNSFWKRK